MRRTSAPEWRSQISSILTLQKDPVPRGVKDRAAPLDHPLLDLSDVAIKQLIPTAKKRGYVTHDQINSVLPSQKVNSEQIADVLAVFSEMGVNVVDTEEVSADEE
jgi:RNA polymerase primary sigma factor